MTTRKPGAHGWGGSLILHGLALAAIFALVRPDVVPPTPMRWEVSMMTQAPRPAAANPVPLPAQKTESPPSASRPSPPAQSAAGLLTPQQVRSPVQEPAFEPVRQSDPIRSVSPAVPLPAMSAPALAAAPATAALPAEAPIAAPRPDPEAVRHWQSLLAAKLMELKRYPMLARRQGLEGVVVLEARFPTHGRAEASVKRSSGHAALDLAAVKLFEDAMEALADKSNPPGGASRLDIPVVYRLDN